METAGIKRIDKSGTYEWPWATTRGLAILSGAAGGGGGGGGASCKDGLSFIAGGGGDGGDGGDGTRLVINETVFIAAGGEGGGGGGGGNIRDENPEKGTNGRGCHYGEGGQGGQGAATDSEVNPERIVSEGGNGGKGYPGQVCVIELEKLTIGTSIEAAIGAGGNGGKGGKGHRDAENGASGTGGFVLLIPIQDKTEGSG